LSSPDRGSLRDSLSLGSLMPSSALAAAMMKAVPHTITIGGCAAADTEEEGEEEAEEEEDEV
jgi:hypothetical protein